MRPYSNTILESYRDENKKITLIASAGTMDR